MVGIGLVGYGYWGPNLARNFRLVPGCSLVGICDQNEGRREEAGKSHPGCQITHCYENLLDNPAIQAVVIATPPATHYELARQALLADKDVLVEKPMTRTVWEAENLVRLARETERILAVDHTFLFTDAVRKIKQLVDSGTLGSLLYIDSVRANLGLFHPDHNVIFDLAPHDIAILLHLTGREPISVQTYGVCHTGNNIENLAYVHLEWEEGLIAHLHLNWLAPIKIRQMLIAGSRQMVVYDDMQSREKIQIHDKGVTIPGQAPAALPFYPVRYRSGEVVTPDLENREALAVEVAHFVDCVRQRKRPLVAGEDGLRVVRILEAAQRSLKNQGRRVELLRPFLCEAA